MVPMLRTQQTQKRVLKDLFDNPVDADLIEEPIEDGIRAHKTAQMYCNIFRDESNNMEHRMKFIQKDLTRLV